MNGEKTIDREFIAQRVNEVIKESPLKIEEYQNGKRGIINMLIGEIKSRCGDKFDAPCANELLMSKLKDLIAVSYL